MACDEPVHDLLDELELRAAVRADLLLDGDRAADAHARFLVGVGRGDEPDPLGLAAGEQLDALGVGAGERLDALGVLRRALQFRAAGVLLDADVDLGLGEHRLLLGDGLRLPKLALLVGGDALLLVGLELLDRDLPVAQLHEDLLDLVVARAPSAACR